MDWNGCLDPRVVKNICKTHFIAITEISATLCSLAKLWLFGRPKLGIKGAHHVNDVQNTSETSSGVFVTS